MKKREGRVCSKEKSLRRGRPLNLAKNYFSKEALVTLGWFRADLTTFTCISDAESKFG